MLSCALGSTMIQAGCLLPTSVEYEEPEKNYRPSFVVDRVTPHFGPLTLDGNTSVELILVAEDENLLDTLYWRLFRPGDSGELSLQTEGTFVETASPPLRTAQVFPFARRLCATFPSTELFVIVADRPFCNPPTAPKAGDCTHESQVPGGLSDENHWTLVCLAEQPQ
jgi:hypothetical protein